MDSTAADANERRLGIIQTGNMDIEKIVDGVVSRFIGTKHERDIKKIAPYVELINELEPEMKKLSDEEITARSATLKAEVRGRLEGVEPDDPDYKKKLQDALEPAIVPAFATAREAGRRTLGMRHFDVQLIGGIVLHHGKIAEMKTGEGKTLVATLPAYLNSLAGRGVHIVTVNDYLARRDAEWMGPIYRMLGLTVGVIVHDLDETQRRAAYGADITYGTNNEFGFDYLRDNMKYDLAQCVQRGHQYSIVDEVDSILIDEARTPLIISGPAEESTDKYYRIDKMVPKLIREIDYTIDEKLRTATLTEEGVSKCERLLNLSNLYDPANMELIHHVYQGLRAHTLYQRDVDYVVKDGEVVIVDEFTGRQMPGRRWSDGLHQAVEAKEGVKIERENQTLATITFQNYFRMYKKLSGMTGTADTEAPEFNKIYSLEVVCIPTNKHLIRIEHPDVVYRTEREKFEAVVDGILQEDGSKANGIRQYFESGQPVLVGSISIEKSEKIAELLRKSGIPHQVLNAKQHEREAKIIAQAGRKGAVTVSTNMAGRGTDILLGGNPEAMTREHFLKNKIAIPYAPAASVIGGGAGTETPAQAEAHAAGDGASASGNGASGSNGSSPAVAPAMVLFQQEGKVFQVPLEQWKPVYDTFVEQCRAEHDEVVAMGGLHILGTERHEARRIDNQLRGRAGRQGDPGESRFFLSLEDDLLRIFGGEKVKGMMHWLGMTEGVPIESRLISKRIEHAQEAVEAQHFEARKHLLEYDDVMNKQRETIYSLRRGFLEGRDQQEFVLERAEMIMDSLVETYCPREQHPDQWNVTQFANEVLNQYGIDLKSVGVDPATMNHDELGAVMVEKVRERYEQKEAMFGAPTMRWLERHILLDIVDAQWKDHLLTLDHLKEGIGLRGYGQKDPLVEFKREAFDLFEGLMDRIDNESVRFLFLVRPAEPQQVAAAAAAPRSSSAPSARGDGSAAAPQRDEAPASPIARQIEQRQRRQQQNLQFQAGSQPAEAPKPVRTGAKVGRNDPCPCGSGKKYKKCHGAEA
ncbi:MAG TPA: preprotein translocase subunit SecA [Candidatus Acidoferrales bacterium]|nr:preprotein translocase subunit SecA [Candidatus Acidoferrales bacterium]